ncbi:putative SUN domain-containing ossification factor [Hypsibius exemplaris]|uniref:SUN domain-containing ossification factor n=1 Tax=Hypsibius exemplaris TaxID=2072580 RepID=A0A1W0WU36_HYPEX|nr:putative SUN domain-containing ossification factor [Hypsibius exemplaris]
MGYVASVIYLLLLLAVVFQSSIFLAEHVHSSEPNESTHSTDQDGPRIASETVAAADAPAAVAVEEVLPPVVSVTTLAPSVPQITPPPPSSPDLPTSPPDQLSSMKFAASAFHPPLVDEFWNIFLLHQRNYFRLAKSPNVDEMSRLPTTRAPGVKAVDEDMPSFEEWRQQRLQDVEKEKSDQAVTNNTGKRRHRSMKNTNYANYASVICGAKVTTHNPELENAGAILTSNRDDYMLNPCKVPRKYFIVELCESVHVHGFDIGNLELFSNVPKAIQVFGSARYPSRDWVDFGRYEMKEARTMQNFTAPLGTGFVKFVRVEMLEHYGKEHYCPITVFRVYGASMVEEYVDSVDDDEADAAESLHQLEDGGQSSSGGSAGEDAYMEKDKWGSQGMTDSAAVNPITMAKDLVVSFMKKAASSGLFAQTNRKHGTKPTRPSADIAPSSQSLSLCFDSDEGWDVATVTCQYVWCLFQASKASLSFCPGVGNVSRHHADTTSAVPSLPCDPQPEDVVDKVPKDLLRSVPAAHETVAENLSAIEEAVHPVKIPADDASVLSTVDPKASKFVGVKEKEQPMVLVNTVVTPTTPEKVEEAAPVEGVPAAGTGKTATTTPVVGSPLPLLNTTATETLAVPVPAITTGVPGQKESVFVRLGNRLKTLELNMSLSGQYLHELSRRFKKQGEDSAKNFTILFGKLTDLSVSETDLQPSSSFDYATWRPATPS